MSLRTLVLVVLLGALGVVAAATAACTRDRSAQEATARTAEVGGPFVPSDNSAPAVVWAVGDGANGSREARALARMMSEDDPDRFLYLGDVYAHGRAGDFERNYAPVYGHLADITAPTPGNHDWPNHAEGYDPYWRSVTGRLPPAYYSFRLAGWEILSLNSEAMLEEDGVQVSWLRRQVKEGGNCRLAFWHRPRYSAGRHGDFEDAAVLWDALHGRAAIVVNGHDHDMQRLKPIDGITTFVSGAGGTSHYGIDRDDSRVAFGNDTDWGALRLELERGLARYAFVTANGRTLDSGSVPCRPPTPQRR